MFAKSEMVTPDKALKGVSTPLWSNDRTWFWELQ